MKQSVGFFAGGTKKVDDGSFWMSWKDFCKYFDGIDVCVLSRGLNELRLNPRESMGVCGPALGCMLGCGKSRRRRAHDVRVHTPTIKPPSTSTLTHPNPCLGYYWCLCKGAQKTLCSRDGTDKEEADEVMESGAGGAPMEWETDSYMADESTPLLI